MGTSAVIVTDSARSLLIKWANEQDSWIRLIASEVLTSPAMLTDDYLRVVYEKFLKEKGLMEGEAPPLALIRDVDVGLDTAEPFHLRTLTGFKNVNALAPGQEIEFNRRSRLSTAKMRREKPAMFEF